MKHISLSIIFITLFSFFSHAQIGSLDPTFGNAGKFTTTYIPGNSEEVTCMLTQPDGKILIGGSTGGPNFLYDSRKFLIARINPDGTRDNTFGVNGFMADSFTTFSSISSIKLQSDGKIVAVISAYTTVYDTNKINLIRLNTDGTYDNSFGVNGKSHISLGLHVNGFYGGTCNDIAIQPDGKIIAVGMIDSLIPSLFILFSNQDFMLARINSNGTLDSSFGQNGKIRTNFENHPDQASRVLIQPDGKIILAGSYMSDDSLHDFIFGVVRYHPDGSLDNSFGMNGIAKFSPVVEKVKVVNDAKLQEDGKIVLAGYVFTNPNPNQSIVLRFNSNGVPDASFGTAGYQIFNVGIADQEATSVLINPNGLITLGGYLIGSNNSTDAMSIRLWGNGTLNGSWGTGGILNHNFNPGADLIRSMTFQPDGKLLVGGISSNSLSYGTMVCRINTDLLSKPTQISPANTATLNSNTVTLKWNLDPTATSYELEYATDSQFVNPGYLVIYADSSNLNLLPSTTYYWKVKAWAGSNASLWSDTWHFTTGAPGNIIGDIFQNPIPITLPYTQTHSNTNTSGYTSAYTGQYNQTSPDIFLKFITGPCADSIQINTCGSNFDTYIHLLEADGTHLHSNDDNGPLCIGTSASLKVKIQPNTTYIAVFEGYSNLSGNIEININEIAPPCPGVLYLNLFIESYYTGNHEMRPVLMNQGKSNDPSITDTIVVELYDYYAPQNLMASTQTLLRTNGQAICVFPNTSGICYAVIKHRNTLETWSAYPVLIGGSYPSFHDFTNLALKAYGNNMIEVEPNTWALFSGDINQDENIDLIDASLLEADINNFAFGYFSTDLNGDGNVDLLDVAPLEANVSNFIFSTHP